jgi:hypothetical protein
VFVEITAGRTEHIGKRVGRHAAGRHFGRRAAGRNVSRPRRVDSWPLSYAGRLERHAQPNPTNGNGSV